MASLEQNTSDYEIQNDITGNEDFDAALAIFNSIRMELRADDSTGDLIKAEDFIEDYQTAIEKFQKVVSEYSDNIIANRALVYLTWCYRDIKQMDILESYLKSLLEDRKYDEEFIGNTRLMLASVDVILEKYNIAIKEYDYLADVCSIEQVLAEALYGKGVIYKYYLDDDDKAAEVFTELIEKYPNYPATEYAEDALDRMGKRLPGSAENESLSAEVTMENYPNPFNPTTTINYSLPEAGYVTLKIYDIQGREVVTLVNENKSAGQHSVFWNGNDQTGLRTASGMYFYKLQFKDKVITSKMILMR